MWCYLCCAAIKNARAHDPAHVKMRIGGSMKDGFPRKILIKSSIPQGLLILSWIAVVPCLAAAADTSADQGARLEEIVVTAQRRVENLQQVPISAQVISGQQLSQQNQNSLEDLSRTVPAVHVVGGQNANLLFIRGIGSGENPSFDQSVATFVDDIYYGRSRLSQATFLDLDRIEVLKGPQSTFFGNNAIAGALNIVTKKPGDMFDAWGRLLYGQFGQYAAEGAVGGPITETFAARLAITRNGDDKGWIDNVNTGEHVPRINNEAARLTLVFEPIENLDATLKTEDTKHRTSGTYLDGGPDQWTACPPPVPIAPSFGNFGGCAQALARGVPIGLDQNKVSQLAGQHNSLSTFTEVFTVNYHQWGHTLTSASGFYNSHYSQTNDSGGLPIPVVTNLGGSSTINSARNFGSPQPPISRSNIWREAIFRSIIWLTKGRLICPFSTS
jgi:iron complex outermembrane receptor protein